LHACHAEQADGHDERGDQHFDKHHAPVLLLTCNNRHCVCIDTRWFRPSRQAAAFLKAQLLSVFQRIQAADRCTEPGCKDGEIGKLPAWAVIIRMILISLKANPCFNSIFETLPVRFQTTVA
jgi:hypothetical protein